VSIPEVGGIEAEPIKGPVTGEEHRGRIVLPHGFECEAAAMGNAVGLRANAGEKMSFESHHTDTHFCVMDRSNG
jgi:hypothetical protein